MELLEKRIGYSRQSRNRSSGFASEDKEDIVARAELRLSLLYVSAAAACNLWEHGFRVLVSAAVKDAEHEAVVDSG